VRYPRWATPPAQRAGPPWLNRWAGRSSSSRHALTRSVSRSMF